MGDYYDKGLSKDIPGDSPFIPLFPSIIVEGDGHPLLFSFFLVSDCPDWIVEEQRNGVGYEEVG